MKLYVMKKDDIWLETILYNDEKKEDYISKGFLVLSEDEMFKQIWDNEDKQFIKKWIKISKDDWYEMLEILPPMKWQHIDNYQFFFISEATTSNIHSCYCKHGDNYYSANRRTNVDYNEFIKEIKEIEKDRQC